MDKKFLLRVNDSFKQLKTKILLNEEVRKMLYYDVVDDNTIAPVIEQAAEHVFLQPVIDVDVNEPFNKKNYITITLPESEKDDNQMNYVFRIIVMCEKTCWNLNNDIRPLLIAQEIINDLDGFKTKLSNTLKFTSLVETVTNKNVCGYSILFDIIDGISDINEK